MAHQNMSYQDALNKCPKNSYAAVATNSINNPNSDIDLSELDVLLSSSPHRLNNKKIEMPSHFTQIKAQKRARPTTPNPVFEQHKQIVIC